MKKSVKIGAIALTSLVLLCSCSEKPNEGTSENYTVASVEVGDNKSTENEYVGYTFEFPKEWSVIRNDGMISVQSNEQNPDERVTISCTSFDSRDPQMAVLTYWDGDGTEENPGYYKQMQDTIGGDFTEFSREELKLGSTGAPALRVVYGAKIADTTYQFSQVVSIIEGTVYTFTYTALPQSYDKWESALIHAVTSFRLK